MDPALAKFIAGALAMLFLLAYLAVGFVVVLSFTSWDDWRLRRGDYLLIVMWPMVLLLVLLFHILDWLDD